ncbi:hypothetical protein AB0B94_30910 [Micromonospora sp. NPDC048986]|uniref:hypothetical protein n=1 Tax=Micromonospora sp. NPDC048986 TaxID=3155644 RepID=UPI0033C54C3B
MPTTDTTAPTTTELLDAVNLAEIWQDTDGSTWWYLRNALGMQHPYRNVTDQIEALRERGLVEVVDTPTQAGLWWLTKRGGRVRQPRLIDRLLSLFHR